MAQQPFMANPDIVKAYQNDPRTALAGSMLAQGMSVKPVAQGGYAWGEGFARVAQALAGALMQKQGLKKYQEAEANTNRQLAEAFNPQTDTNPLPPGFGPLPGQTPDTANAALPPGFGDGMGMNVPGAGGVPPAQGANGVGVGPASPDQLPPPPMVPQAPANGPQSPATPSSLPPAPMAPQAPAGGPQPDAMAQFAAATSPSASMAQKSPLPGLASLTAASVLAANTANPSALAPPAPVQPRIATSHFGFTPPLEDAPRTSGFGQRGSGFHNGQDYAGDIGDPVHAAGPGVVIAASPSSGPSGNFVKIKHPDGSVTGYAHLSQINVKAGDTVSPTTVIGAVGNTGHVVAGPGGDGAHLHLTYRDPSGKLHDPTTIFGKQYNGKTIVPQAQGTDMAQNAPAIAPADPTGLNAPQTVAPPPPLPDPVARPEAPSAVPAVKSERLAIARRLMASGNPYLMETARHMADEGLGEQNTSDREFAARQQGIIDTGYRGDIDNFTGAAQAGRQYAYNANTNATEAAVRHNERLGGQQFTTSERLGSQEYKDKSDAGQEAWQSSENALNRANQRALQSQSDAAALQRTTLQIEGKHEDVRTKQNNQRNAFLNTQAGARIGEATAQEVKQQQNMINLLDEYATISKDLPTGGIRSTAVGAAGAAAFGDPRYSRLRQITQQMLPLIRMRNDPMSDGDRRAYEQALPNIGERGGAAQAQIGFMRRLAQRHIDFELGKLDAQAQGTLPQFLHSYQLYAKQVSVRGDKEPMSFDQWRSTIPKMDAQGRRVQ